MMDREQESPYEIGVRVACADGECGRLRRVIIDPEAAALRHLVVGRDDHTARLVPMSLVSRASAERITLICTRRDFDRLEPAEVTEILGAPTGGSAPGTAFGTYPPQPRPQKVTFDSVPAGEAQIRRGDKVHAADGDIGKVQGLVADGDDQLTHVLLTEGHLWGRKEVAVPIGHIVKTVPGIQLDLTRGQVRELPPVDLAHLG